METNWNTRCIESIREQKREIAKKYNIRFGQTDIYCAKCGKPWGYGKHTCQDIRFEQLKAKKDVKRDVPLFQTEFTI